MTEALYYAVTFIPEASGRVQLARTGSGFYRWDHPERFAIDHELLSLMLRNTQLRRRPIRMDFMHYANGKDDMPVESLGAAGCIDPDDITLEPWREPGTGVAGFGLFAPNSWTSAGWSAVEEGIDEISPVIDWHYELPEDVFDPETGETIQAGTMVGPCITGVSLVDRGFFWMDKVKLYSERGASPHASLYQEYTMPIPLDKLKTLIEALMKAGFTDEEANVILVGAMKGNPEPTPEETLPAAETTPAAPAVPAVLAARVPGPRPATTSTTIPSLAQMVAKARAAVSAPGTTVPPGAQGVAAYGERLAAIETRLTSLEDSTDEIMLSELERQGLLVNIPDARKLYKEAPAYFRELVSKATTLTAPSPAGANRPSGLRTIANNAALTKEDKFALDVKTYREGQAKLGRKIDQVTAIAEVEAAQEQAKQTR